MLKEALTPNERDVILDQIKRHFPHGEKQNERIKELESLIAEGLDERVKRALSLLYELMLYQSAAYQEVETHESRSGRRMDRYVNHADGDGNDRLYHLYEEQILARSARMRELIEKALK